MNKNIDIMAQLLDNKNIPIFDGTRNKVGGSGSDNKERCHALVVGSSDSYSFIIDLGASRNMASNKEFFTSMYLESDPTIRMGDYSEIRAKGFGKFNPKDGYFNNVFFVPDLAVNLLSVYQMNHTREAKRVTFTLDTMEIAEISTNKLVDLGFVHHQARMYKFSHFLPYSRGKVLLSHANETNKLWHERFVYMN